MSVASTGASWLATSRMGEVTASSHTHTHTFFRDYPGEPVPEGKTNLDFTEARDSERQWHQLGHMQGCISLQTDNHASTPQLKFFTGRMSFMPPNQQCQSTDGKSLHRQTPRKSSKATEGALFGRSASCVVVGESPARRQRAGALVGRSASCVVVGDVAAVDGRTLAVVVVVADR